MYIYIYTYSHIFILHQNSWISPPGFKKTCLPSESLLTVASFVYIEMLFLFHTLKLKLGSVDTCVIPKYATYMIYAWNLFFSRSMIDYLPRLNLDAGMNVIISMSTHKRYMISYQPTVPLLVTTHINTDPAGRRNLEIALSTLIVWDHLGKVNVILVYQAIILREVSKHIQH